MEIIIFFRSLIFNILFYIWTFFISFFSFPVFFLNRKFDVKVWFLWINVTSKILKTVVKKEVAPLKPVESATIKVGSKVRVQLGNSPMHATITEISGKDISVQLDSGMVIKTQLQNIYL